MSFTAMSRTLGGNMTILSVIDRTFRIYRVNFLPFVGIVALVTVPIAAIQIPLSIQIANEAISDPLQNTFSAAELSQFYIPILTFFVHTILAQSMMTYMASENHIGRATTLGEAFREVRARLLPTTGAYLAYGLMVAVLFTGSAITMLCIVGIFGMALSVYIASSVQYFLLPVLILERNGPVDSIMRAWNLGKRRFWQVFWLFALVNTIGIVLALAFQGVAQFLYVPLLDSGQTALASTIDVVVSTIVSIFTAPIAPIALTVMYYDTRVRLEGLDMLFYFSKHPDPRPQHVVAPKPEGSFLRGKDYANVLILLGLAVGFYVSIIGIVFLVALVVGGGF